MNLEEQHIEVDAILNESWAYWCALRNGKLFPAQPAPLDSVLGTDSPMRYFSGLPHSVFVTSIDKAPILNIIDRENPRYNWVATAKRQQLVW